MKHRYVIDTNVLIAASAGHPVAPTDIDATPNDPEVRLRVFQWLERFESSESRLVLDCGNEIFTEYGRKLESNDYGLQVVRHKWDTAKVDCVDLEPSVHGYCTLPEPVRDAVHDPADRKFAAAAYVTENTEGDCAIAFASDTDWHGWEDVLADHGISLEAVIEDWSRPKYLEKLAR
jgi:hypothetical protein